MLIELTIENFKSILEPTNVSFVAGTTKRQNGNLLRHPNGERVVKSMSLYGPNASGKTTVLDGLYALGFFVLFSNHDQKPTTSIPRFEPFGLDKLAKSRPARVSIVVELEGNRYTLDVSATNERVWSERLSVQHMTKQPTRKTNAVQLIARSWEPKTKQYRTELHDSLGPELTRSAAREQTPANRLMIGKLASLNCEAAMRIVEWFDDDLDFYDMHRNPDAENSKLSELARLYEKDKDFAAKVIRMIRDADTGIQELQVADEKTVTAVFSESDDQVDFKETVRPGLLFQHFSKDNSKVSFNRGKESSGTLRFLALLVAVLQPSLRRRLICIDELSASMHPDLVRRLIQIVHSSSHNPNGNQIFFTTHDTHLMGPNGLLRRDQVTICTKDHFGRSRTQRLDEFQDDARSDANLQKQYLDGRFGGIPQFGPSLEDVRVDDVPLEVNLG